MILVEALVYGSSREQVLLHQDCLWGLQNERGHKQRKFEPVEGSKTQRDFINFTSKDFVNIGLPIDWTFDHYQNWYPAEEHDERTPQNRVYHNFCKEIVKKQPELRKSLGHLSGAFPMTSKTLSSQGLHSCQMGSILKQQSPLGAFISTS